MFTKIKAFLTTKFYFTKGQVITQGMLYQLEKENATLRRSCGQLRAHNSALQWRLDRVAQKRDSIDE